MNAPRLNRQLVLEAPTRVADGAGGYAETWAGLGTLWADVQLRSGRERAEAGMAVASVSYRVVVRAAPVGSAMRPAPEQRFREGERIYAIRAVSERDADGRYLVCFADEEVAA